MESGPEGRFFCAPARGADCAGRGAVALSGLGGRESVT
jgi:hypothetical protein